MSDPANQIPSRLKEIQVQSSVDGTDQPSLYHVPPGVKGPAPLLVLLHYWSLDYRYDHADWVDEAERRGWCYLQPNFRGPNFQPEACGSAKARQDILDAIAWCRQNVPVDPARVYVAGVSGGGHMTMLMIAYHPTAFAAASEWVGISNLALWHAEHYRDGEVKDYARNVEACVGGPPGSSEAADRELRLRSPIHHLQHAADLPIDFNAGVLDGHTGSVPIHHTLDAFNVIARATGGPEVPAEEIEQLWTKRRLDRPTLEDTRSDPAYQGRKIFLRRYAGASRVTIFEGGHEGLAFAACEWLSQHRKAGPPGR
jgi:acetyl esterase/lipase